jgi:glycosyltransferase involved in cell wall biosynthesis
VKRGQTTENRTLRLISFSFEGVFSPVLDAQMVTPLALVGRRRPDIRRALLVLTSARHRAAPATKARMRIIREALPGATVLFKYRLPMMLPLEEYLRTGKLRRALTECGFVGDDPIIVHARGEGSAAAAARLKRRDPRIRVFLDLRGAQEDELRAVPGRLYRWYLLRRDRRTRRLAMAGADAMNTVSVKLAEHVRAAGYLEHDIPSCVVGCCTDTTRFHFDPELRRKRRKELGLSGKFVVCYSGGMAAWQRPDVLARTFAAIRRGMPDAHMLVLSHEPSALLEHLLRLGVSLDTVIVRSARHAEVASYLMAADVGLLLREDTLTNRVASPVKFAEYLRCGLPVILTPHIGDFSELASAQDLGQVIAFDAPEEQVQVAAAALRTRLETEGHEYRSRCSSVAGAHFSWDVQIDKFLAIYDQIGR